MFEESTANGRYQEGAAHLKHQRDIEMTKTSIHSVTDSEIGSELRSDRASKLGAILCPTLCALLLVCIFVISFIGTKLAYEQYDAFCTGRRFDVAKLYIFPNFTIEAVAVPTTTQ